MKYSYRNIDMLNHSTGNIVVYKSPAVCSEQWQKKRIIRFESFLLQQQTVALSLSTGQHVLWSQTHYLQQSSRDRPDWHSWQTGWYMLSLTVCFSTSLWILAKQCVGDVLLILTSSGCCEKRYILNLALKRMLLKLTTTHIICRAHS